MKTRKGNHVHSKLTKIAVKLSRETKGTSSSGDCGCDEVVKVSKGWVLELQSAEANVVKSLVIKSETLVSILYKLMNGKSSIVRLHNGVRYLGRRNDRVSTHDTIGVVFTDLGNKKSSHTRSGSSSHGVSQLKSLKHITSFGLLANYVHDLINELSSLGVMSLCPVITSSALSVYEVIGSEKLSVFTSADRVHGSWLKIGKNCTRNITSSLSLVEVYVDTLELKRIVSLVCSRR